MSKQGSQLGTPKRPLATAARELGKFLRAKIKTIERRAQPFETAQDVAEFHNLYTAYMALVLAYSTGTRPVWGFGRPQVFDPDKLIDPELAKFSGRVSAKKIEECLKPEFCTWRDKDGPDGYHTRMLWLTPMLRKQLMYYQRYLDRVLEKAEGAKINVEALQKLAARTFFFLRPGQKGCEVEEISPAALRDIFDEHGYRAPSNVNRSFLKSEWLELNGPPDVIELFLGHWERGEEGFTASSALHPADYKGWLETLLPKILEQLKFEVVVTREKPISSWRVSAVIKKNSHLSKKTLSWDDADLPGVLWKKVLDEAKKDGLQEYTYTLWQKKTLCLVKKHLRGLYDAPQKLAVSQKALDKFYYRTLTAGLPPSMAGRRQLFVRDLLALGIKKNKWRLELPKPPTVSYREKNLLKADLAESLTLFHRIEQAMSRDLAQGLPQTAKERVGQILLSAVLYGGLLRFERIEAFTQALGRWPRLFEGWLWLDVWQAPLLEQPFLRARAQKDPAQYARWFADPTTQRLIEHFWEWALSSLAERLQRGARSGIKFTMVPRPPRPLSPRSRVCPLYKTVLDIRGEEALEAYLSKLTSGPDGPEVSLEALGQAAFARALTCVPPFLAAYATGRQSSTPLSDQALLRVLSGDPIALTRPRDARPLGRPSRRHGYSRRTNLKSLRQDLCRIPRRATETMIAFEGTVGKAEFEVDLREKTKKEIEAFLRKNPTNAVIRLLGEWAIHLLSFKPNVMNTKCQKPPHAFSTVESYLSRIGDHLLDFFHKCDLSEIDDAVRQRRYRALLEHLETQTKKGAFTADNLKTVQNQLAQFDFFVHDKYDVPRCQFSLSEEDRDDDEAPRRSARGLVNGNVLTAADFNRTLEILGWTKNHLSRLERIRVCCAILGRRLGLRRSEILGLRLMDVERVRHCDVLVRRHKGRRVKSKPANRRMPFDLLLPSAEYEFVQEWIRDREEEPGVGTDDYLFTQTERHRVMPAVQDIMVPIRQAIREATGDDSANFHHLRHSFYSDLILQLVSRQDMEKETPLPSGLQEAGAFNAEYLDCVRSNLGTGRGILHGMTIAIGHADVPTGLHSYFHHCDWLLAYFSRHPIAAPWFSQQAKINLLALDKTQRKAFEGSREKFPYHRLTKKFSSRYSADWQHPLLEGAAKIQFIAPSHWRAQPSFDEVLQWLWKNPVYAKDLSSPRVTLRDREFLEAMYDYVMNLDDKERDREIRRIQGLAASYSDGFVQVHKPAQMRACLHFCSQLGIPSSRLKVVPHPRQPGSGLPRKSELRHRQDNFYKRALQSHDAAETKSKSGCRSVAVMVPERTVSPLEWLPVLDAMFRGKKAA